MQSFDVVIAGGGMVGLALACGLQGSGLRIAVLEKQAAEPQPLGKNHALRVSAINAASECLLRHIGVWENLVAQRVSPYNDMQVWDKDSFGKISFSGEEFGFSHLGHIIENPVIQQVLWQRASQLSDITLLSPTSLKQVAWGENEAFITLQDDSMLTARLVVGADGAHSWLRQHADIPLTFGTTAITRWSPTFVPNNLTNPSRVRHFTATVFWRSCRWTIHTSVRSSGRFHRSRLRQCRSCL